MKTPTCAECRLPWRAGSDACAHCGYKTVLLTPNQEAYLGRPSFGALFWTQGYAFGSRLYGWFVASLVPGLGFVALILLLVYGRRWSWRAGVWSSFEEFQARQRLVDRVAILWLGTVVLVTIGVAYLGR